MATVKDKVEILKATEGWSKMPSGLLDELAEFMTCEEVKIFRRNIENVGMRCENPVSPTLTVAVPCCRSTCRLRMGTFSSRRVKVRARNEV